MTDFEKTISEAAEELLTGTAEAVTETDEAVIGIIGGATAGDGVELTDEQTAEAAGGFIPIPDKRVHMFPILFGRRNTKERFLRPIIVVCTNKSPAAGGNRKFPSPTIGGLPGSEDKQIVVGAPGGNGVILVGSEGNALSDEEISDVNGGMQEDHLREPLARDVLPPEMRGRLRNPAQIMREPEGTVRNHRAPSAGMRPPVVTESFFTRLFQSVGIPLKGGMKQHYGVPHAGDEE